MVGLTFTGSADLVKAMNALSVELRHEQLLDALRSAAEPMRDRMEQLAPHGPDAPHLADNIVVATLTKVDGERLEPGTAAVGIGPRKSFFYGLFWEFSWRYHPTAHPFVRPAYDEGKDRALTDIGRGLWDRLTGRGRSTTSGLT